MQVEGDARPDSVARPDADRRHEAEVEGSLTTPTFRWIYGVWIAIAVLAWAGMAITTLPGAVGLEVPSRIVATTIIWALISLLSYLPILLLIAFLRSERGRAQESAETEIRHHGWHGQFLRDVREWYATVFDDGRYPIPATLALLTFTAGWGFVIFHAGPGYLYDISFNGRLDTVLEVIASGPPVSFGFLGAYFFAAWFLFKRYVGGDLGPGAFLHVSVRTWLITILTLVATVASGTSPLAAAPGSAQTQALSAVAFLGALTPTLLLQVIADSVVGGVRTIFQRESREASLSELDGMNAWKAARLVEEGIDNVQNLAMEDPARLLVVTREGGLRILDWVDQAILLNAAGKSLRRTLHDQGIRTASDLYLVFSAHGLIRAHGDPGNSWYEVDSPTGKDEFGIAPGQLRNVVIAIVHHPNFERIREMREQALRTAACLFGTAKGQE